MAAVLKTARARECPRGFESHTLRSVMSQDIEDTPNPRSGFGVSGFAGRSGCAGRGSWWLAGGLVDAGGVEGELAEEFSGGGVDDADFQVVDEQEDAGSGVGSADAD